VSGIYEFAVDTVLYGLGLFNHKKINYLSSIETSQTAIKGVLNSI
jgi:hypothetical protein